MPLILTIQQPTAMVIFKEISLKLRALYKSLFSNFFLCILYYSTQARPDFGGGAHLPWDNFAPLLKFPAPSLTTFAPPLIILLTNTK